MYSMMDEKPALLPNNDVVIREKVGSRCILKRILLTDVLPLGVLVVMVVGITLIGGAIFLKLEENAEDGGIDGFGRSVEYSLTLITTVGYGHITTVTQAGRLATVFYGMVGIPIFFAAMFKIGSILANVSLGLFALIGLKSKLMRYPPEIVESGFVGSFLATLLGLLLFILYLVGTTFLVKGSLDWHYVDTDFDTELRFIDAFYFNFVTLSTTGFGDLVPYLDATFFAYLIAGIALVFTNIVLVKHFIDQICLVLQRELRVL